MTDEAAESRGPATTGTGPSQDAPAPSAPPSPRPTPERPAAESSAPEPPTAEVPLPEAPTTRTPMTTAATAGARRTETAEAPMTEARMTEAAMTEAATAEAAMTEAATAEAATAEAGMTEVPPAYEPPPAGATAPDDLPPPPPGAGGAPPPWSGSADGFRFSRDNLVRPTKGRYVAGVCGALGRATNTDPVLWRVVLAVLGFFGGVGLLIYLVAWLVIPGETDTASPIESLLGRGRSGMTPVSIVLLGIAAVLTFAFVVNDGFRAALLAVAVLIGAALLLKRHHNTNAQAGTVGTFPPPARTEQPAQYATTAHAAPAPPWTPAPTAAPAEEPVTHPLPPPPPGAPQPPYASAPLPPQFGPPSGGYRPPFAPHGPWAGSSATPPAPPPVKPPKPPKPPKEKSRLGRITFFGVLVVMGLLALLSAAGVSVPVSAFFAAALATIGLGLIVGAWFGRSRGLIVLAVVATIGLAVSSGLERYGSQMGSNVYRPAGLGAVADQYDFTVGNAVLDLRRVNFTGAQQDTTVRMKFGQVKVLVPATVDTTADVSMSGGRAFVFGREFEGRDAGVQPITNLGADGAGGGTLRLTIVMDTGNVEVTR